MTIPPIPGGSEEKTTTSSDIVAGNAVTVNSDLVKPPRTPSKKMIALGILVLVLIAAAVLYMSRGMPQGSASNKKGDAPAGAPNERVIPTIDPNRPSLRFEGPAAARVGEEITVRAYADSQGADINGYDLLLAYDSSKFKIVRVESAKKTFKVYTYDRGSYYSITGIKDLNDTSATPFTPDKPLLTFVLRGVEPGVHFLEVIPSRGKETSKFVDADVTVIKPQLQPIRLEFNQ